MIYPPGQPQVSLYQPDFIYLPFSWERNPGPFPNLSGLSPDTSSPRDTKSKLQGAREHLEKKKQKKAALEPHDKINHGYITIQSHKAGQKSGCEPRSVTFKFTPVMLQCSTLINCHESREQRELGWEQWGRDKIKNQKEDRCLKGLAKDK